MDDGALNASQECLVLIPGADMTMPRPAPGRSPAYERGSVEFNRALAFFDATFAIALTLLVTTLDGVSSPSTWASVSALLAVLGPQLFAFALSFAVIAFYWLRNHQFFARLRHVTRTLVVANLVLIAFVVLLPFTTEALGDLAELPLPTAVYALNIAATSGTEAIIFCLAWTEGLMPRGPRRALLVQLVPQVVPPAVFLGSVPLAYLWSPTAARVAWLSIAVLAPVAGTWAGQRGSRG